MRSLNKYICMVKLVSFLALGSLPRWVAFDMRCHSRFTGVQWAIGGKTKILNTRDDEFTIVAS